MGVCLQAWVSACNGYNIIAIMLEVTSSIRYMRLYSNCVGYSLHNATIIIVQWQFSIYAGMTRRLYRVVCNTYAPYCICDDEWQMASLSKYQYTYIVTEWTACMQTEVREC